MSYKKFKEKIDRGYKGQRRLRIVSDGHIEGTKIIDIQSGQEIAGVEAVEFIADAKNKQTFAKLTLVFTEVDLIAVEDDGLNGNIFLKRGDKVLSSRAKKAIKTDSNQLSDLIFELSRTGKLRIDKRAIV